MGGDSCIDSIVVIIIIIIIVIMFVKSDGLDL